MDKKQPETFTRRAFVVVDKITDEPIAAYYAKNPQDCIRNCVRGLINVYPLNDLELHEATISITPDAIPWSAYKLPATREEALAPLELPTLPDTTKDKD